MGKVKCYITRNTDKSFVGEKSDLKTAVDFLVSYCRQKGTITSGSTSEATDALLLRGYYMVGYSNTELSCEEA